MFNSESKYLGCCKIMKFILYHNFFLCYTFSSDNMNSELNKNIEDYLDYLRYERKLSYNTYLSYRYNFIKISSFFKGKDLLKLSSDDIREFLYKSKESEKTRAHYLTVLKSFYYYMQDLERIKINPCDEIKAPKISKGLPKFLTEEEVDKLLDINLRKPVDHRGKGHTSTS